jgi:hypothetical protein
MTTYKFLATGAIGPLSGFAWPAPLSGGGASAWVEVEGPLEPCVRGVHVCRPVDLAHWLHEELWETETEGDSLEALDCLVVRRARLVRRVEAWSADGAARFADACRAHALAVAAHTDDTTVHAFIEDARLGASEGYFAVAAYCTALAVAKLAPAAEYEEAYRRERAWQGAWIAGELIEASRPA